MDDPLAAKLIELLRDEKQKKLALSAWSIFRISMDLLLDTPELRSADKDTFKKALEGAIQKLLVGADGKEGTADDLITREVADSLRTYLNDSLVVDGILGLALKPSPNGVSWFHRIFCCMKPPTEAA